MEIGEHLFEGEDQLQNLNLVKIACVIVSYYELFVLIFGSDRSSRNANVRLSDESLSRAHDLHIFLGHVSLRSV